MKSPGPGFQTILELIKSNPGITIKEMTTKCDICRRTIQNYVRFLKEFGYVRGKPDLKKDARILTWYVVEK
jgi:predicted transcriptional regulator